MDKIKKWYGGVAVIGGILLAVASVSPEAAASNLGAWARYVGITDIVPWLERNSADEWAIIIGAIIFAFAITMIMQPTLSRYLDEPVIGQIRLWSMVCVIIGATYSQFGRPISGPAPVKSYELTEKNRTLLNKVLSLPIKSFPIYLFPLSASMDAARYGEQLAGFFRSRHWQAQYVKGNYVTTNATGLQVIYSDKASTPPQNAIYLKRLLDIAGVESAASIRPSPDISRIEKEYRQEGLVGIEIGKAPSNVSR